MKWVSFRFSLVWLLVLLLGNAPKLLAEEPQKNQVVVLRFAPISGESEGNVATSIRQKLTEEFTKYNWEVIYVDEDNSQNKILRSQLANAKTQAIPLLIAGFYERSATGELRLYGQVYSSNEGILIDALSMEPLSDTLARSGIELEEARTADERLLAEFTRKLVLSVRANPRRNVRSDRVTQNLLAVQSLGGMDFPQATDESEKTRGQDVFKLLAEKEETISIVSRRVGAQDTVSKAAAIVTVFNRRQIEQSGARNLTDMLKLVPGVEVFYDQMGFYKVAFRGIRSKSGVLLLLDGQRINNFYDGSTFLDIRADVIEKIEIIRGPGSSVHGTNAFVGVINVITREPERDKLFYADVSQRLGMFRTSESSGFVSSEIDKFRMSLQAHLYDSDRQSFHIPHDRTCPPNTYKSSGNCPLIAIPLPKNKEIQTNDRKHQVNAMGDVWYDNNYYLKANIIYENRGPNIGELNTIVPDSQLTMALGLVSLGVQQISLGPIDFSARLYSDFLRRDDSIQVERPDILAHAHYSPRKHIIYDALTLGSEVLGQYEPWTFLSLLTGVQLEYLAVTDYQQKQNYQASFLNNVFLEFRDYDNLPKDQIQGRTILGVFTQAIYSPWSWLSITTGVRLDHYSDFGSTLNPKGGVVVEPLKSATWGDVTLKLLYGTAFRAPTIQEMYDKTQLYLVNGVYGNEKLKPETIQTAEVGIEYVTPFRPVRIIVNGFYNRIYNNIEGFNTSSTLPTADDKYRNLRGIETVGGESTVRFQWDIRNYAYVNASLARSRDFGGFPPYEAVDVVTNRLDVPQLRANIAGNLGLIPYVDLFTSVQYSSFRAANYRYAFEVMPDRRFRLEEYWLWNMSVASAPEALGSTTLRLTVFNILDEPVYDDFNIAMSGFENRVFPKEGRYVEFKASLMLFEK